MTFLAVLFTFLFFTLTTLSISYLATLLVPYLGFFPYREILMSFHLPKFIYSLGNFDGAHYILIAKNGYSQYEQAFFPLYPVFIHYLSLVFLNNYLITGLLISNICFLFGLYIFSRYLKTFFKDPHQTLPTLLLFLLFPTSFFLNALYTEGLFFLLLISTLYALKKEKYFLVIILAILSSLTRIVGVFLLIPIFFHIFHKYKSGDWQEKSKTKKNVLIFFLTNYHLSLALISPILGLSIYSIYLWFTTKDPLFFLHSQWAFGAHRSSSIIFLPQVYYRYINIFFTAKFNFQYFIALIEFFIFNFVIIVLILDIINILRKKNFIRETDSLGLNLFSFANLILPTLTGTFSSIPRYALFSISFFIYFSQLKNVYLKTICILLFSLLHILLLSFFIQGYFVS